MYWTDTFSTVFITDDPWQFYRLWRIKRQWQMLFVVTLEQGDDIYEKGYNDGWEQSRKDLLDVRVPR